MGYLYIAEGISHFLLWFMDAPDTAGIELFARTSRLPYHS